MTSTKNQPFLTPGERLKYAFGQIGISQGEGAKAACVSAGQISKWILGQNELTEMAALAFQAALGISKRWLLQGEGDPLLVRFDYLPDDLKELADLWPRLNEKQRQYVLGVAEGVLAATKETK